MVIKALQPVLAKDEIIAELLAGLDTLRPVVLSEKTESQALRTLMRRLVMLLESLQMTPSITPALHAQVLAMLAALFDAEHGALLTRLDSEHDAAWQPLEQHASGRKALIQVAQQDLPLVLKMLRRGCDLLGKEALEEGDLAQQCIGFERHIRSHLKEGEQVHTELSLLMAALQGSVQAMGTVLAEVGDDSPELAKTQKILQQDLPSDPKQAQNLLRQAREGILQAGKKLSHASVSLKQTMSEHMQQMSALSARLEQAEAQARNDPLTGLANRRKLTEHLAGLSSDIALTFVMLDIDHFKVINDRYGHDCGDEVLEKLAELLQDSVRETDMVARLGGEEFCIVLAEADVSEGMALAENIRLLVELFDFATQYGAIDVCISLGVAERGIAETHKSWIKRADDALYVSKHKGRNQVTAAKPAG